MTDQASKYFDQVVEALQNLPGVGRRTATRYALFLLKKGDKGLLDFAQRFEALAYNLKFCKKCNNLSEFDLCNICSNPTRNTASICVVEDLKDIIAIEQTTAFKGLYHVLGGLISPMDGIGPGQLNVNTLIKRVEEDEVKEVILALSTTSEGDTTAFYLYRKLQSFNIEVNVIARGVGVGNDLEYVDELTLGRSILSRTPYQNQL